jgi:hypothetical protein
MQYSLDIQTVCVDGSVIVDPFPGPFEAGGVRWDIVSRDPAQITGRSAAGASLQLVHLPDGIAVRIDGEDAGTYLRPEAVPDDRLREFLVAVVRGIRGIRNAAQSEGKIAAAATLPGRLERTLAALGEPGLYGSAPAVAPLPPSRLFETGRARAFALGDAIVRVAHRSLSVSSERSGASMRITDVDYHGWNAPGDVVASVMMREPELPEGSDPRPSRTSFSGGKVTIQIGADGEYEVTADDARVAKVIESLVGPLATRQVAYLARIDAVREAERVERAAAEARRTEAEAAERAARAPIEEARRAAAAAEMARLQALHDAEAAALRAKVSRLAVRL